MIWALSHTTRRTPFRSWRADCTVQVSHAFCRWKVFCRWKYFVDLINIIVNSLWRKEITLDNVIGDSVIKNPPTNAGDAEDTGSILGLGRFPAGGNGNPLQYSCLENSMDRGAWWATVHGVAKSWTQVNDWAQSLKALSAKLRFLGGRRNFTCRLKH